MSSRNAIIGVYRIRCIPTGDSYIGASTDIASRLSAHRRQLENGTHHNKELYRLWCSFGPEAFEFDVVENVSTYEALGEAELEWAKNQLHPLGELSQAGVYHWKDTSPIRSIRMSDEDMADAIAKGESYGLKTLTAVIHFALKQLRHAKK